MKPFPFYYERLPTYQEVLNSLMERDIIDVDNINESWFSVCRMNEIFELWNKEYIEALSKEIRALMGEDLVLEVAAGDGMLSHWLREHRVNIKATDSMERKIKVRSEVEALDAISAIRKYNPRMAIASWIEYGSELDCEILDEDPEYLILIGEGNGGCTGSTKFWGEWDWDEENSKVAYWRQKRYHQIYLDIDAFNICRTDYAWSKGHGCTILYSRAQYPLRRSDGEEDGHTGSNN